VKTAAGAPAAIANAAASAASVVTPSFMLSPYSRFETAILSAERPLFKAIRVW
jgi:hypothetical protein